jgi:vacuolar-type H+-ATPase subunit C/Vma6
MWLIFEYFLDNFHVKKFYKKSKKLENHCKVYSEFTNYKLVKNN